MGFDPYNCSLKIWESIRTPTPKVGVHLEVWRFIPSHSPILSHSRASLLARTFASPYFGCKPKVRVATHNLLNNVFLPIWFDLLSIHNLIKFSQLQNLFVYDFVVATKVCQGEIYELYIDLNTRLKSDAFESYNVLLATKHDSIIMR
jgi:hypothetical protein